MPALETMPLGPAVTIFVLCAAVIGVVGTRLARVVDTIADRTGLGEAVAGAVLLGLATSLSGSVLSVSAAWSGNAELAVSNAVGGIAVQTLFLAVADMTYRRANLEHAAASLGNMMQGALLVAQMALLLVAITMPEWTIAHVHVASPVLLASYLYGIRLVRKAQTTPMWAPAQTRETKEDVPEEDDGKHSVRELLTRFLVLAVVIGVAGWFLEKSATVIAEDTGLGNAVVGSLFTAFVTSLPELVTTLSAVRSGALTLAVAGIIGGNAFDTLFAAVSDVAYREGSVYHAISTPVAFWVAIGTVMTAFLLMGLIRREQQGPGRIGFESVTLLALYAVGVLVVVTS